MTTPEQRPPPPRAATPMPLPPLPDRRPPPPDVPSTPPLELEPELMPASAFLVVSLICIGLVFAIAWVWR